MASDNFYQRLTRLFRSGPALQRRVKGQDYRVYYDKALQHRNLGHRGPTPFGKEASPFSMLGGYGILDRISRYVQVSEMEQMAEIGSALDLVSHEVCSTDEKGRNFHIFTENTEIKKALEELFYDTLNVEFNLRPWVRNLLKYGDFFVFNEVVPDIGIINCSPLPVNEIEREEGFDPEDPAAVRFKWLTRGNKVLENWQVCHFRILENDLFLPYGSCLKHDTRIYTPTGVTTIDKIQKNQQVLVFDQKTKKHISSKVLDVVNSGEKECFSLKTRHNFVEASKEHKICVLNKRTNEFEYKFVEDIIVGDQLIVGKDTSVPNDYDFVCEPVISKESTGSHQVWDIHVENENHNFIANGIVVHNSILEPARRVFNQIILAEDAMLTYRVVRSPERRVFYIDVGQTAPNDIPSYMEQARAALGSNTITDKRDGRIDYRYNAVSILEDYYIPVRGELGGTKIETLAGGQHISAIEDIEYLQKKLFAALKIPKAFLGYSDELGSKATLSQLDIRFSRTITVYQKIIIAELNKLAMLHLFAKGFDGEDLIDFELFLSNPSSVALQQKLALWNDRIDIAAKFKESKIVSEEWIQKEILSFTNEEIAKMKEDRKEDVLYEKELEVIAVSDENQEQQAVVDPFDQSSYQVPGADVPKAAANVETGMPDNELVSSISKFDTDGNVIKVDVAPGKGPVQATPYATQRRRNEKRRVGMGGRSNLANPDFSKMLDMGGRNPGNVDPYDYDFMKYNLKEKAKQEEELRQILRKPRKLTYEMKKMLSKMESVIGKPSGRKLLIENFDEKLKKVMEAQASPEDKAATEILSDAVIKATPEDEIDKLLLETADKGSDNQELDLDLLDEKLDVVFKKD